MICQQEDPLIEIKLEKDDKTHARKDNQYNAYKKDDKNHARNNDQYHQCISIYDGVLGEESKSQIGTSLALLKKMSATLLMTLTSDG